MRSSSDLPEPVAPTSSPCGPMPSCADSLRSRSTGSPSGPMPIGIRSTSPGGPRRPAAARVEAVGSAMPSSCGQVVVGGERRCSAAGGQPQRREPAGQGLGLRLTQGVRHADVSSCPTMARTQGW